MRTRIQKWGNSLAVRIPKAYAVDLGIGPDAPVELSLEGDVLVLRPRPGEKYRLESLLAEVNEDNLHEAVDWGGPVGREDW